MTSKLQLVMFAGLPGTGKSSLARVVARSLRAVYLDKDTIKDCAVTLAAEVGLVDGETLAGPLSYELLIGLARDNLTLGHSVLLDSPAGFARFRDKVKRLAQTVRAELRLVECICTDEQLLRQRIEARGRDLPDYRTRTWASFQQDRARFERIWERHLIIDTAQALAHNQRKVLNYLSQSASS